MDGARELDLDDPAEHVPAIRGKKSRLFAARHVRLATDDLSEDEDVGTAGAGMPPTRLTYKEKMVRAKKMSPVTPIVVGVTRAAVRQPYFSKMVRPSNIMI